MARKVKHETSIVLQENYKDEATGFEGRAVAVTFWENGCVRVQLERAGDKGRPEGETFDEQRLVKPERVKAGPGGPRDDAEQLADAVR